MFDTDAFTFKEASNLSDEALLIILELLDFGYINLED